MFARARRTVWLYRRCLEAHLRAALEYQADFWLIIVAAILTQVAGLVFLGAVFSRIPRLDGWTFAEVVVIFALMVIAEGIGSLFFEGAWHLPWLINQGELDYALVRPYSVIAQVMSSQVGLNGIGNLLTGGILLGWGLAHAAVDWSVGRVAGALVLFASAIVIKLAITLATNTPVFWLMSPNLSLSYAVHQIGELGRYPVTIYASVVQVGISVVIPFAFVGFFPASAVLGHGGWSWIGWTTPLVAAYSVLVAGWLFRRGLIRYESAGA
jgi:ABC-2 type transport system permease protein